VSELPGEFRADWARLAEESRNVFATPEFLELWWRHFGSGRRAFVDVVRDKERVAAILPVYAWRERPLRVVRVLGDGAGDELGPICAPADRALAARALLDRVRDTGADVFLGEQLPRDAGWRDLLGARLLAEEGSPVIRFADRDWDALLGTLSSNFRQTLRRRERKLDREHAARYRLGDDPERLPRDLDALFDLHDARWRGTTPFRAREGFHRDFAALALERGWLRLWLLEIADRTVAAWLGFRFAGAEIYFQAGRDPAWERESVGLVLLAHTIRSAQADGMTEYRFGRGGESYKYRFTQDDRGLETLALATGAAGSAALAAARGARAGRRALREASARLPRRSARTAPPAGADRRGE
jgi:CelD/BcsL family acetyltransferase involved in cellulose biosynthesis